MVNPLKHANNLNEEDLEKIYNNLCREYERARDFNTKKNLNQQILILILLCRRFPVQELVKVGYDFFKSEPHNSLLYKHLLEQSLNNYCKIDGLLLTNRHKKALTVENVEEVLSSIDKGGVDKELSVESLGITNSIINDFGKKNFDKKKVRKHIDMMSSTIEVVEDIVDVESDSREDDLKLTDRIIDEISERIIDYLDDRIPEEDYAVDVPEFNEKLEIIEDSLSNKHNQLSNKMGKIHQNIKASNSKYKEFDKYFNEIALVKDSIKSGLEKQDEKIELLIESFDELLERMDEMDKVNTRYIDGNYFENKDNLMDNSDKWEENTLQVVSNEVNFTDYKEFMYNWFCKNLKITKSPHYTIDIEEIILKLDKYLETEDIGIDKDLLYDRLESYLGYWYNKHDTVVSFKELKNTSIKGNEFYSNLKFINFNEERENRIKNSIVAWLKENTCEVEGSKTYTKEIFGKIEPIFRENGWIITTQEEWKELHDAGFSKAVPSRTFSQIIGKAVQEVYQSISKNTIQRDTPSDTGVTWYPNIEILDKSVSGNLQSTIESELSNDIFESDNIIYCWLKDNLIYTSLDEDKVQVSMLLERILKHLQVHEINISEESLKTLFNSVLEVYLKDFEVESYNDVEIIGFKLENVSENKAINIIHDWVEDHIIITGNVDDMVYLEDINEKLLSHVYHENINVVNDSLYSQLPTQLQTNVITQARFEEVVKAELHEKIGTVEVDDNINGSYCKGIQIIRYKKLKQEHIHSWINNNIEELLKRNVASKDDVIENFKLYITEHNIKNTTQHSIEKLLDVAMDEYYSNINEVSLKVLNDTQNEYYVLITA